MKEYTEKEILIGVECCLNAENTIECEQCPFNGLADAKGCTCKQIVWEALKSAKADILGNANNE